MRYRDACQKNTRSPGAHLVVYILFRLRQFNQFLENVSFLIKLDTLRPVIKRASYVDLVRWMIPAMEKSCQLCL